MAKQRTDTESVLKLVVNNEQAKASAKEIADAYRKVSTELINMKKADDPKAYEEKAKSVSKLKSALNEAKKEYSGITEESKKFHSNWKDIAKGLVAGSAFQVGLGYVKSFVSGIISSYAQSEKFAAVLTNALGSRSEARKSLKSLEDFAVKTPFQLEELTQSYIKLVNRGFKPTMQEMTNMGDLASSQGKSMDMLVEAILDAQTGEFERLKEFGVRAKSEGDKVTLTFKGQQVQVQKTDEAIRAAILSFGEMPGIMGAMAAESATVGGKMSNVADSVDQILKKFGEMAGGTIFNFFDTLAGGLDFVNNRLLGTKTEAQALTEAFDAQASVVNSLEKNTVPLLSRYDELITKGNLNKTEQSELKSIIDQIANTIPNAVTEFDKYGNALGINTDKAREFIATQRAMLKYQNQEAIEATKKQLQSLEAQQYMAQKILNSGKIVKFDSRGELIENRDMTNEEISKARQKLIELNTLAEGARATIKRLNGEDIPDPVEVVKPKGTTGPVKTGKIDSEVKYLDNLLDKMSDSYDRALTERLDQVAKEEEAIKNKYDKERREAEENLKDKTKLSAALKAIKKSEEAELLTLTKKRASEEQDLIDKLREEAQSDFQEFMNDKAMAQEEIFQSLLSDQEREQLAVDQHYEKLILLAEQYGLDTTTIYQKWTDAKLDIFKEASDKENKKALEDEIAKKEAMIQTATQVYDAIFQIIGNSQRAQSDARISALEQDRDRELSNRELTRSEEEAINKKYDDKIREEKKRAWRAEQRAAIVQALINGALAMTKVAAQTGVLSFAFNPLIAAATAAQVAVIAAQKPPQYRKGGIPDGPSHEEGGIKLVDGITGNIIGEMEGGERILSREDTRLVDDMIYGKQRQLSSRLSVNASGILEAERLLRYGDRTQMTGTTASSSVVNNNTTVINTKSLEDKMDRFIDAAENAWNYRMFEKNKKRFDEIRDDLNS